MISGLDVRDARQVGHVQLIRLGFHRAGFDVILHRFRQRRETELVSRAVRRAAASPPASHLEEL